jgi:adenylate kinase
MALGKSGGGVGPSGQVLSGRSANAPAKRLALILFGSPGSGKGTQAGYLTKWLGTPHISTGDMLRQHIAAGDTIGQEIAERMRSGGLVSDDLVNRLVFERIQQPDSEQGFILDGYPRTTAQAEEMSRLLEAQNTEAVVIHLSVDYNVIISRMSGRRVCPKCGTLYNAVSHPPKVDGICDLDGAALVVRDDDREDVVRERLTQYERQTRPLIDFFRGTGDRLIEVDASRDKPGMIFEQIRVALRELVGK